jgi:hypothetical protein
VQAFPPELPKGVSKNRQITRQSKQFTRREMLDRLGLGRSDLDNQDLLFCECYPEEEKRFLIKYTIRNEEGKITEVFSVTKGLPKPIGPKSSETLPAASDLKGMGRDRQNRYRPLSPKIGRSGCSQKRVAVTRKEANFHQIRSTESRELQKKQHRSTQQSIAIGVSRAYCECNRFKFFLVIEK